MLVTTATELPRLMACIGSRLMPAALPPDHDHEARDEGIAAHWTAQQMHKGQEIPIGTRAPNGYIITADMIEHVLTYIDALEPSGTMEVDCTFSSDTYELRARADHIVWECHPNDQHQSAYILTIDDFKYGWRLVSPEHNWTLIAYAIGWCIKHQETPATIIFRIHQPRPYHPDGPMREWRISYEELLRLHAQINNRLRNPTNELVTSPQCAKCHALADCPTAREASMNAIDASGVAFSDTLPDHVLAYELDVLRQAQTVIDNRAEALEELMTHKIKMGGVINGWHLKPRYAQTRWKPGMTGQALSAATGVNLLKDGVVTPAEAKRRGVPEAVVTALTERPPIGSKLERIDADAVGRKHFG